MIKTFTQNDLIRFLYHETSAEENLEIKRQLELDSELQLQLSGLRTTIEEIGTSLIEPSAQAVEDLILQIREKLQD
jgi:hypothetical protein